MPLLGGIGATEKSLLIWMNGDVALGPADWTVDVMFANVEAIWQISESRLVCYPLLSSTRQRLRREDSDKFHIFVSIVELVDVLKDENRAHARLPPNDPKLSDACHWRSR